MKRSAPIEPRSAIPDHALGVCPRSSSIRWVIDAPRPREEWGVARTRATGLMVFARLRLAARRLLPLLHEAQDPRGILLGGAAADVDHLPALLAVEPARAPHLLDQRLGIGVGRVGRRAERAHARLADREQK